MKRVLIISLLSVIFFIPFAAFSQSGGSGGFLQKAERKAESRWTLQGWLEQKDRNKMMDLWLAMNSPSPYEFYLGGAYQDFNTKDETAQTENHHTSGALSAGAYSGIIGLEGFYENNSEESISQSGGSLNLRIVGNAVQGTHLIIGYGYRSMKFTDATLSSNVNQPYAIGDLNLYFTRHFGLSGHYRYFVPVDNDIFGSVSGNRAEAGAFIDFSFLRIFGSWYSEKTEIKVNQVPKKLDRTGILSGIKFFF